MRRRQQRLHAVAAADLDRHDRFELAAKVLFHRRDGAGNQPAVDHPFQDDERRAHHRHDRDGIVIVQLVDVDQVDPRAIRIETAQISARRDKGCRHLRSPESRRPRRVLRYPPNSIVSSAIPGPNKRKDAGVHNLRSQLHAATDPAAGTTCMRCEKNGSSNRDAMPWAAAVSSAMMQFFSSVPMLDAE